MAPLLPMDILRFCWAIEVIVWKPGGLACGPPPLIGIEPWGGGMKPSEFCDERAWTLPLPLAGLPTPLPAVPLPTPLLLELEIPVRPVLVLVP